MNASKSLRAFYILILLWVSACSPAATPTAQPTATLAPTALPTATAVPSATAVPTATTAPTSTSAPTATTAPSATSLPPLITPGPGQVASLDMVAVESDLTRGFAHGFINGGRIYFVQGAWNNQASSIVVSVDQKTFALAGALALSLESASAYFVGGFTDGSAGYFPTAEGEVTRLNLKNFTSTGLSWLKLMIGQGGQVDYLSGGFNVGQYAYYGTRFGLYRVDLKNFTPDGATFLDTHAIDKTTYLWGGVTDGRYAYFASQEVAEILKQNDTAGSYNQTKLVRIDLQDFTPTGVTILDLAGVDPNMMVLYGSFLNGDYLYLAPDYNGKITRIDTKNFTPAGVTSLDLSTLNNGIFGYVSAFTSGNYGYFLLNSASGDTYKGSGKLARVDLTNFTMDGVTWLDVSRLNPSWNDFMDGMADSQYLYLEPGTNAPSGGTQNTSVVRVSLDYAGWAK